MGRGTAAESGGGGENTQVTPFPLHQPSAGPPPHASRREESNVREWPFTDTPNRPFPACPLPGLHRPFMPTA
ncbi:hypothetical protein SJA_C1-21990 [Sphingobium indicum UT26S]|uniref:Uncharacterized protein n=1 Tax=Sphingobium indicum (strain DSM 16413 / CCM 7287 / MTCC 6362 / UT26 / NBRC 101211 / UT26S) TaxID=452662 RepID=D4Z351_SPHIU|nr:hypothetical protein SJA_C1-21990 [Sphingobium indicum UT26S]